MQKSQGKVRVFRSSVRYVADGHVLGQGYQSVSFAAEQSRMNKVWALSDAKCKRILSEKAISVITSRLNDGTFEDRMNASGPPYMAPSVDPMDYSRVGFPKILGPCAGANGHLVVLYLYGLWDDIGSMRWL